MLKLWAYEPQQRIDNGGLLDWLHTANPKTPIEETMRAMIELQRYVCFVAKAVSTSSNPYEIKNADLTS